jgi:hypothetical protein
LLPTFRDFLAADFGTAASVFATGVFAFVDLAAGFDEALASAAFASATTSATAFGALADFAAGFAAALLAGLALARDAGLVDVDSVSETGSIESFFFTISGALQAAYEWATRTSHKA